VIDVILSHLAAFALGGVVMAQLIALNQRPHPPRRPLDGDSGQDLYALNQALFHVGEARAWVSCVTPRGEDHVPTFMASLEQMLRRRIDACQRRELKRLADPALRQPWPSDTFTTPPQARNAHD
jgi:hypothetical protein